MQRDSTDLKGLKDCFSVVLTRIPWAPAERGMNAIAYTAPPVWNTITLYLTVPSTSLLPVPFSLHATAFQTRLRHPFPQELPWTSRCARLRSFWATHSAAPLLRKINPTRFPQLLSSRQAQTQEFTLVFWVFGRRLVVVCNSDRCSPNPR